ncbi:endonuclease V, partial [Candidatus Woesearchaeota archaeon]|nr:endonuclease V [Candidatus Woesearchaeota archaeon]
MTLTSKFKKEQFKLAEKVEIKDSFSKVKTIAAVDQAFTDKKTISGIVVLDFKTMEVIEKKFVVVDTKFPYMPTYLGFREGPAIVEAFNKLEKKPDLLMVDGHGIAHPRRIGLASHVGLMLDIPTIGVAKKLVVGEVQDGKIYFDKEFRGFEIITKEFAKPVYVSPGHKIGLGTTLNIVKATLKGHKLPEPMQIAHAYV